MSEAAKAARSAMKDKIKRLLMPLNGKVDASDYGPEEVLNADVKTGMRPISRRAYKSGGTVSGECGPVRADRKPRNSGGKATTPNSMINRNDKDANEDREGKKHVGALARGGVPKGHYDDDKPSLRLIKTHTGPDGHVAKVYKDRDYNEYRTKFFKPDGLISPRPITTPMTPKRPTTRPCRRSKRASRQAARPSPTSRRTRRWSRRPSGSMRTPSTAASTSN